jgi:hypothetical protein
MKKLQNYVEDITLIGGIKDEIFSHLNSNTNMARSVIGRDFLNSIYNVEPYKNKLE